ncbi:MAG: hypothetical protein JST80_01760 [Bdellovibrionales bacterium]|nr:hypothetical protein [Bdellovibrionales bacterium]
MERAIKQAGHKVSMDIDVEYLLYFLEDELRDLPDVRIHAVAPSTTRKSPDLPQDYDPNEGKLHLTRGVRVVVSSREYFFPASWAKDDVEAIRKQAQDVRDFYNAKNN